MDDILPAIETIYDCIGDRFDHQRAVEALSEATFGTGINLLEITDGPFVFRHVAACNVPEGSIAATVEQRWDARTHSFLKSLPAIRERTPILRRTFVSDEAHYASALYKKTSAPWGLHSDGTAVVGQMANSGKLIYRFVRHPGQEDIDHEILSRLAVLNRHLWRAINLQNRINGLDQALARSNSVFDLMDFGLVLFRADNAVSFCNRAARRMIEEEDGIAIERNGLLLGDRAAQRALSEIFKAEETRLLPISTRTGGLRLPRPSGKRPYTLLVTPVPAHAAEQLAGVNMVVFIFDPEDKAVNAVKLFVSAYDLTPAEATLAHELARGTTLDEYAAQRGVTRNTAKWHLQSIFEKTETSRQTELVSLLLRSVAGLNLESPDIADS